MKIQHHLAPAGAALSLWQADSREALRLIPADSVDSCVTDPPYALVSIVKRFGSENAAPAKAGSVYARASSGFMGRTWDTGEVAFTPEFWVEVLRVLKPGAHLLAFGGTRTYHRLACAIEDAGFEIRDQIGWAYGSGFPKSHDVSKGIDRAAGAERETLGVAGRSGSARSCMAGDFTGGEYRATAPATEAAKQWDGWGTALKPAWEPIMMARKPLTGTVAANVQEWRTGALNIAGCRVDSAERWIAAGTQTGGGSVNDYGNGLNNSGRSGAHDAGRWPANLIHDGSEEVLAAFPNAPGQIADASSSSDSRKTQNTYGAMQRGSKAGPARGDSGSAARFFKSCNSEDLEWLAQNLSRSLVLTANPTLCLQSLSAAIAHVVAASLALPAGTQLSVLKAPSIRATASESRAIVTAVITAMQNIGPRFLREWQQEKLSPSNSPVNVVATREPTGTTKIIASHWKSDGSAEPVIFAITPQSLEAGAPDSVRFKYCAKASKKDRNDGCDHLPKQLGGMRSETSGQHITRRDGNDPAPVANHHPTVKPTELMRYLCRLVTPPHGVVLDPFMGSGSTGRGAALEGFGFIGIEREAEYWAIANARVGACVA